MKKIYLTCLMLCLAFVASAQTLTLTLDGEVVANGSTVTKVYDNDVKVKVPGVIYGHGLFPEVFLTSSVAQNAQVTFTDPLKEGGTTCCFGGLCVPFTAENNYTIVAPKDGMYMMSADKAEDLQIHYEHATNTDGNPSAQAYSRTVDIAAKTESGETFTCRLVFKFDPNASAVENLQLQQKVGGYYTLDGVRVEKPTRRGIYIVNGRKVVK